MTLENILTIMEKFDSSESAYLELEIEDVHLKLKKANITNLSPNMQVMTVKEQKGQGVDSLQSLEEAGKSAMPQIQVDYIKAPLVGVYYAASSPDKEPFVKVGSSVEKGDTVCLIEAMKMMSEVVAPRAGIIKEILVENGDLVEFDKPLFVIE